LPEVWTGSHLDSVPGGGRFDGPLGVLGGLEAVRRIGGQLRTLTVVAFRDEEGWRFGRGCFGSRALCGRLEPEELATRDAGGVMLGDAIGRPVPAGGWLEPPHAYVELHIEQGPVLAGLDAALGVVTSIVGLARLRLTCAGRAGHAGTTPMAGRDDALCRAAELVLGTRDAAVSVGSGAVATIGKLAVLPGAANVIPGRVDAIVDARAPSEETLQQLLDTLAHAAGGAELAPLRRTSPVAMADLVQKALAASIEALGLPAPRLHSGAGHDAGVMGQAGVPSGMLFVRSLEGGISHAPEERSDPEDVELGIQALAGALQRLASA
jgi:hydantoinase/carbamoylase family amidase